MSYLLQNGDGHLKNVGLLYKDTENIDLAPAYDIVCITAYIKNDIPALMLAASKRTFFTVFRGDKNNGKFNQHTP